MLTALAGLVVVVSTASAAPPAGDCRLPASPTVFNEHEGPTDYSRWLEPDGPVPAVVLFVDFPDARPMFNERTNRRNLLNEAPGRLVTSSYGRASTPLTFDTAWRRMPQPHTAYSGYNQSWQGHKDYLQAAITAADGAVNFRNYKIVYVIAPKSATGLPNSPAFIASPGTGINVDGVEIRHGVTFGQDIDYWKSKIVNHETGHLFGLPDLYNYAPVPNVHAAVGGWDLMGLISGPAPDHFAWHKWKMGWLDDPQIACQTATGLTTATLTPLGTSGGVKAHVVRTGPQRAVVVENRQVSPLDVESDCFVPGVLVYVVDSSVGGGANPVTVADRTPGSALADCDDATEQLDNATLVDVGHEVVANGVRVKLTGKTDVNRTVEVTW
jgi:M6 family metalloprotease-like protein